MSSKILCFIFLCLIVHTLGRNVERGPNFNLGRFRRQPLPSPPNRNRVPHKTIHYYLGAVSSNQLKTVIIKSMNSIMEKTDRCLEFILCLDDETNKNVEIKEQFPDVINQAIDDETCASFAHLPNHPLVIFKEEDLGSPFACGEAFLHSLHSIGATTIWISTRRSCHTERVVVHEFFHTLGFDHSENRGNENYLGPDDNNTTMHGVSSEEEHGLTEIDAKHLLNYCHRRKFCWKTEATCSVHEECIMRNNGAEFERCQPLID